MAGDLSRPAQLPMPASGPLRLFVPAGAVADGRLHLEDAEATRLYQHGARAGHSLTVLDDSGWEFEVVLELADRDRCEGVVAGRKLAPERRTQVSLYQGLLHPSDFRRLVTAATALGIVSIVPTITDGSEVPMFGMQDLLQTADGWHQLSRDAAEASGRGRRPAIGSAMLLDHALDAAARSGAVLLVHPGGVALDEALAGRPFTISLVCPPPSGFTTEEILRATARQATIVAPPLASPDPDPTRPALATLEALFQRLEGA